MARTSEGVQYRLLGPVEVHRDGVVVDVPGARPQLLLTALLLAGDTVVSSEELIDTLWDGRPPASARPNLRNYVTVLRRCLGAGRVISRRSGHRLVVEPDELDSEVFARLAGLGRAALAKDEPARAGRYLSEALALWRGRAGEGLPARASFAARLAALDEQRLLAQEDLVEARLGVGRHAEQVGVIRGLLAGHPLRERLWAALIVAHYRCGDTGSALAAFAEARSQLAERLEVEPGPRLRQLHAAVRNRDPELLPPSAGVLTCPYWPICPGARDVR